MEAPKFSIGQSVNRIEDREITLAIVLGLQYIETDKIYCYLIAYAEGGQGYWNEDCLTSVN